MTGHDRWCPSWSRPRDLLLSGRPAAALDALPARTLDLPTGVECDVDLAAVEAMAAVEVGRDDRALELLRDAALGGDLIEPIEPLPTARGQALSDMYEAQQNMRRFADELERAGLAARAWLERLPHDPRAADRLGEIAFLAGRFDESARWFARSVRLGRARVTGWTAQEATGLLTHGTALVRAERLGAAVAALERADEIATRADAQERGIPTVEFASYHARVQAGDALLRDGRYAVPPRPTRRPASASRASPTTTARCSPGPRRCTTARRSPRASSAIARRPSRRPTQGRQLMRAALSAR